MAVEKIAASFTPELLHDIRQAVADEGLPSVSAWLSEAARLKLRRKTAAALLADYEKQNGLITEDELEAVRAQWPA